MAENRELAALREAKAATAKLRQSAADLAAKYAALVAERERVKRRLAPVEECIANVRRLVDEARDEWVRKNKGRIARSLSGGMDFVGDSERLVKPALPKFDPPPYSLTLEDLCGIAPDLVKASLERAVRGSGADHAASAGAREKRLAEIDAELRLLEEQHTSTVDGAAEVGLELDLLPHVRAARDRAREGGRVPSIAGAVSI